MSQLERMVDGVRNSQMLRLCLIVGLRWYFLFPSS
jgi:hypothetical protein